MIEDCWNVKSKLDVLLVGVHKKRHVFESLLLQKFGQFFSGLFHAGLIVRINDIHKSVCVFVVIFPVRSDLTLTSNVPHIQLPAILSLTHTKATKNNKSVTIPCINFDKNAAFKSEVTPDSSNSHHRQKQTLDMREVDLQEP